MSKFQSFQYPENKCEVILKKSFSSEQLTTLKSKIGDRTLITIYGLCGVGKGTLSSMLAQSLDIPCIETGMIWRVITFGYLKLGLELNPENTDLVFSKLKFSLENKELQYFFDDQHLLFKDLKTPKIDTNIARFAADEYTHDTFFELVYEIFTEVLHSSFVVDNRGANPPYIIKCKEHGFKVIKILLDCSDQVKKDRYRANYLRKKLTTNPEFSFNTENEAEFEIEFEKAILARNERDIETQIKIGNGIISDDSGFLDSSDLTPQEVLETALNYVLSSVDNGELIMDN